MIVATNIEFIRGGKPLLENASATINPKQKVGLVGANGCGKSSFFTLLKQEHQVDAGELTDPSSLAFSQCCSRNTCFRH